MSESQWPFWLAMLLLILASGFFSGSEAAFFSLQSRDLKRLRRSGVAGRLVNHLLTTPDRLLAAILFWNLLINMTYFALVAILSSEMSRPGVFTLLALLTIIFFSEMLPKSFAVMTPARIAISVCVPISIAVQIISPILPALRWANGLAARLLWPSFQAEGDIDLADIERAIELGTDDAALIRRERAALQSLVAIAETRVEELMRPRSRLMVVSEPLEAASILRDGTPPGGYLLVVKSSNSAEETFTGSIATRLLRPNQFDELSSVIEAVLYVPWSATVSKVYDQLEREDVSVAVVVNEFGEVVGGLSTEDILRAILASNNQRDAAEDQIKQIGSEHFRMPGTTSLRTLAKKLSIALPEDRAATVSGYLQKTNERVPRVGDVAPLAQYELVVTDEGDDEIWIEVWLDPATMRESS